MASNGVMFTKIFVRVDDLFSEQTEYRKHCELIRLLYFQRKIGENSWLDYHSNIDDWKLVEPRNVCSDNRYNEMICLRFEAGTSSIRGKYHVGWILVGFQKAMRECMLSVEQARILGSHGTALGGADRMDAALRLRCRKSMCSSFPTACPENIRLSLQHTSHTARVKLESFLYEPSFIT
jgi:hypothetical protein